MSNIIKNWSDRKVKQYAFQQFDSNEVEHIRILSNESQYRLVLNNNTYKLSSEQIKELRNDLKAPIWEE